MDPRMSFKQHVDETLIKAWEIGNSTRDSTVVVTRSLGAHRCPCWRNLIHAQCRKERALFEKLSASKRESEEYGLKEDSRTTKIDPLTRKF
jgi:hypothetical protein